MKTCSKCKVKKDLEDFNNFKSSKDGKYPSCKKCVSLSRRLSDEDKKIRNEKIRLDRLENPEKYREREKRWVKKNAEKAKKSSDNYYKRNRDNILLRKKQHRCKNLTEYKDRAKRYRLLNKQKESDRQLNYRRNQREILSNQYVKKCLKRSGFHCDEITTELIETKREIIKINRLIRQK